MGLSRYLPEKGSPLDRPGRLFSGMSGGLNVTLEITSASETSMVTLYDQIKVLGRKE